MSTVARLTVIDGERPSPATPDKLTLEICRVMKELGYKQGCLDTLAAYGLRPGLELVTAESERLIREAFRR